MRGARVKALRRQVLAGGLPFTRNAKRAYLRMNAPPPCMAAPTRARKRKLARPVKPNPVEVRDATIALRALYNDKRSPTWKGLTRQGRAKYRPPATGPARIIPRSKQDRSKYMPRECFAKGKR